MTGTSEPVGGRSHRTARGAAIRGGAEVAGKLATLAWTVAASRLLTSGEFGVVSYGLAMMLFVSTFPSWGFDAGVIRRGAAEPENLDRLYAGAQWWKTLLALPIILVTALVIALTQDDPVARWCVAIMLMALLPEVWSKTVRSASSAQQKAGQVSSALVIQRLVTGLLIIGVLVAGAGMIAVACAFVGGTLIGWAAHARARRRIGVQTLSRIPSKAIFQQAVQGTWLIGLNGLLLMLLMRVDVLMLGGIKGVEAVAVYALAYRLLETVLFVTFAVNQAVFPVLSASRDASRWRRGYERSLAVGAFIYLPFMAVCVVDGPQVIGLLFGDRYSSDAGGVLLWLAPAPLFFAAAYFASTLLMAMERPRPMLLATAVAAVVNVGLNAVLIPMWAGTGAAIATTLAYAVQAAGMQIALHARGITPRLVLPVLPASLASVILAGVLWLLPWALLVELVAGAVVYLCVWLLIVGRFDPMQRDVLFGLVRRA